MWTLPRRRLAQMLPETGPGQAATRWQASPPSGAAVPPRAPGTGLGDLKGVFLSPKSQYFYSVYLMYIATWACLKELPQKLSSRPDQVLVRMHLQLMSEFMEEELEGQQDSEKDKKECLLRWSSSPASHEEPGDQRG